MTCGLRTNPCVVLYGVGCCAVAQFQEAIALREYTHMCDVLHEWCESIGQYGDGDVTDDVMCVEEMIALTNDMLRLHGIDR